VIGNLPETDRRRDLASALRPEVTRRIGESQCLAIVSDDVIIARAWMTWQSRRAFKVRASASFSFVEAIAARR